MPGPAMLGKSSAPVYMCVHGGTFKIAGSSKAVEGSDGILGKNNTPSPFAPPCLAPVMTNGVMSKCEFGSMNASGSLKNMSDSGDTITAMDIQMSTSNGLPFMPVAVSTKVIVL